jgi:hypothetical protein
MRHPYRERPPSVDAVPDDDEQAIYGVVAAVGAIPLAIAIASGERFGVDATLGLVMVGAGVGGLWSTLRRR